MIVPVSAARRWSCTSSTVPTERKNISIIEKLRQTDGYWWVNYYAVTFQPNINFVVKVHVD